MDDLIVLINQMNRQARALPDGNDPYIPQKQEVHGNRPGDVAARQKRPGDIAAETPRPGDIAVKTPRPGDVVPCRPGDIVVGICQRGETERGASHRRRVEEFEREMLEIRTAHLEELRRKHASPKEDNTRAPQPKF